jgi:hypothetical protein
MGKHVKVSGKVADVGAEPEKRAGKYAETPTDTLEMLRSGLVGAFEAIQVALQTGEVAPALVREMAGAARSICTIEGELRAREKARRHTARTIPREVVIAYVRELSEGERSRLVMEISAMAEGSVMG